MTNQDPHRGQHSRNGTLARTAQAEDEEVDNFGFSAVWRGAGYDLFGPFANIMTRANLEVIGWMTQQAWACIEMPSRFMLCLTPQEVIAEQDRFVDNLVFDYHALTSKLVDMFTGAIMDGCEPQH